MDQGEKGSEGRAGKRLSLGRGRLCWSARALPNLSARFSRVKERVNKVEAKVSSPLSPISYLFQLPTSPLSQKLQHVLSELVLPPVVEEQRRPGPKDLPDGIPGDEWPTVLQRVLENHESSRKVAADYGVSRETIRRLVRASKKAGSSFSLYVLSVLAKSRSLTNRTDRPSCTIERG